MDSYRYAAPVPVPVVDDNRNVHCRGGQWPFHIEGRDIEHHVIHTDIGRYLGNGATVMKGVYNVRMILVASNRRGGYLTFYRV